MFVCSFVHSFVSRRSHRPRRVGVAAERKRKPRGAARSGVVHIVGLGGARSSGEQRKGTHTRSVPVPMSHGVAAGQAQSSGPVPTWQGWVGTLSARMGQRCRSPGPTAIQAVQAVLEYPVQCARASAPVLCAAQQHRVGEAVGPRRHLAPPRRSAGRAQF